jgi:hypothetical protein
MSVGDVGPEKIRKEVHGRFFEEIVRRNAFERRAMGRESVNTPNQVLFSVRGSPTGSGAIESNSFREVDYRPWNRNAKDYELLAFMRSLKAHVVFDAGGWRDARATVEELERETVREPPFREVVRMASLVDLWKLDYREALRTLVKVRGTETDARIRKYLDQIIEKWER